MKDLGEESFSDDHYRLNFGGANDAPVETEPSSTLGTWVPPLIEGPVSRPEFGPYLPDFPGEIEIDYSDGIPSDDAIVKQQNSIQAEVAETLQYVGDRVNIEKSVFPGLLVSLLNCLYLWYKGTFGFSGCRVRLW